MTAPSPAEMMIGKYQILELAGEGAMGAVYRARDTVLNRMVAIKVMNATIARDSELRDRFLREAQSAGSLQHPNVVTVFDFGEVDGHLFIAMEFVAGSDLEEVMAAEEQPSIEAKLEILIDALAGLAYAHQRGIVHRDLKPANIRVTTDGRAKLMDFGVAHLESSKMTKTGTMIGTPSYMAPEYISGKPVTTVSDIFSMGAVLYHVLTGVKPFDGDSLHAVLFSVVSVDPPLPSSIVPTIPSALDGIVRRAMAKEPADRYQTALEMATALTSLRAQMKGLPANETQSLSTTLAHRVAARGADAARDVAARTSAGATASRVSSTAIEAPPVTAPEKRNTKTTALVGGVAAVVVIGVAGVILSKSTAATSTSEPVPAVQVASADSANTPAAVLRADSSPSTSTTPAHTPPAKAENAPAAAAQAAKSDPTFAVEKAAPATKTPPVAARIDSSPTHMAMRPDAKGSPAGSPSPANNPASTSSAPPATTSAPVVPPPSAEAAPVRDVPTELREVVNRYAQAISARDLSAIRSVYPRITNDQQKGFEQFFASTKALQASLSLGGIDVKDGTAQGRVSGTYVFTSSSGRNEKQNMNFRATFEKQGDKWVLSSVQ